MTSAGILGQGTVIAIVVGVLSTVAYRRGKKRGSVTEREMSAEERHQVIESVFGAQRSELEAAIEGAKAEGVAVTVDDNGVALREADLVDVEATWRDNSTNMERVKHSRMTPDDVAVMIWGAIDLKCDCELAGNVYPDHRIRPEIECGSGRIELVSLRLGGLKWSDYVDEVGPG